MAEGFNSAERARRRAIRTRMQRTGESYTVAARRHDEEVAQERARRVAVPVAHCPQCVTGAVVLDLVPECGSCEATWQSGADLADEYASEFLGLDRYTSGKDGGEPPTSTCSDCGEESVVVLRREDATMWTMLCLSCATPFNDTCGRCGVPIQLREEGDLLTCSDCWQDVLQRD